MFIRAPNILDIRPVTIVIKLDDKGFSINVNYSVYVCQKYIVLVLIELCIILEEG